MKLPFVFCAALLAAGLAHADTGDEELLRQADRARGGNLPGIVWTVDLAAQSDGGKLDERRVRLFANATSWNAEFLEPNKIRGQRLLKKGTNMWFTSPGLHKSVPISQRQRLTGGAANGDIASTNYVRDYRVERVADDAVDGKPCRLYELAARDNSVTYDKVRYWVAKGERVGVKAEFLSNSGKLLKTARFEYGNRIAFEGKDRPFISQMRIEDALERGNVTLLSYSDIKVGEVPAEKFAQ